MDAFSLKTASTYVNNLLLARGLLQNGKAIEFAKPAKGDGGTEATMAQILNVMHDLILRRDVRQPILPFNTVTDLTSQREQEQRESLVQTIRSLRTEAIRSTNATEKLQTKNEDLTRQLSLSQSQERSARTALKSAESAARTLREEMLRLKTTVAQVRTACANDVRKRDVQIQKLKTHLTAQQRGNKTGLVGASITITPGVTGVGAQNDGSREEDMHDLDDPEYSLRQESNEFLTSMCQGLSDENDNWINLVRSTLSTLRELQGMSEGEESPERARALAVGDSSPGDNMVQALPTMYDGMAAEIDGTLHSLRSLLTNPNFVSVDEVTIREEEIARLRAGFERLESRWKEAIALMGSWQERMANGGDTVNLEEIKQGLGLGVGFGASVMMGKPAQHSMHLSGIAEEDSVPELEEPDFDSAAEDDEPPVRSPHVLEVAEPVPNGRDFGDIRLPPIQVPLKEADGNVGSPRRKTPRTKRFDSAGDENMEEAVVVERQEGKADVKAVAKPAASRLPRKVCSPDLIDFT